MKRYIKCSVTSELILAKGIVISDEVLNNYNIDITQFEHSKYVDVLVEDTYKIYYVAYTQCMYYPDTNEVSGHLLNHDELVAALNLTDVPYTRYTSFRVDVSSDNRYKTELTTSGSTSHAYHKITSALNSKFSVSSSDMLNEGEFDWVDIHTPEFKHAYESAARYAESATDLHYMADEGVYENPYFAVCFAIIDPKTDTGIVSESPDTFLFTAYNYDDYKSKTSQFAESAGLKRKDLIFKTCYSASPDNQDYELDSTRTGSTTLKRLTQLLKTTFADDSSIRVKYDGPSRTAYVTKRYGRGDNVKVYIEPIKSIIDPEIMVDRDGSTIVAIPEHFSYRVGFEDMIEDALDEQHDNQ